MGICTSFNPMGAVAHGGAKSSNPNVVYIDADNPDPRYDITASYEPGTDKLGNQMVVFKIVNPYGVPYDANKLVMKEIAIIRDGVYSQETIDEKFPELLPLYKYREMKVERGWGDFMSPLLTSIFVASDSGGTRYNKYWTFSGFYPSEEDIDIIRIRCRTMIPVSGRLRAMYDFSDNPNLSFWIMPEKPVEFVLYQNDPFRIKITWDPDPDKISFEVEIKE